MAPASSSPPPKLNNFAVAGSTAKASPPAPTPTPEVAVILAPSPPPSSPKSAAQQPPAAPSKPAPLPSSPPRPSVAAPSKATDAPAATTTKAKKVHTTTKVVEIQEGKQQPIEAPAAVTLGSLPPTTLSVVGPSTLTNLKGAPTPSQKPSKASVITASSPGSTLRSTGPSQPAPSLVAGGGNNNSPLSSTSIIGSSSDRNNTNPHVNGTPTSTILAISVVGVLVVLGIVGFVVRRRLKNEERLVLGSGGRGRDGGGVSRGWKTLDEDGQGQFADDLKTEKGFSSGGGGGQEMAMNDGASFVWGGQGYRGADVEEQEREEQEQAYWRQQQDQQGYQETARVSSFYPPTPPKLYAAQMAPPPTRPPRPDDGNRIPYGQHPPPPSGVRNLYAPHSSSNPSRPPPPPPQADIPQGATSSSQGTGGPSYSAASSLHPSHAVTHHPPVRTKSKTAATRAGGGRDLLKKNVRAGREQQEHLQEGDRTSRGNFGSLMMMDYDEEGAMSPLPTHPLSPTFLPYHQDRANTSGGADENGFVPLSQMAFERKEPKYRSPIESIFETYEGEDTTAADSRTSYAGSYVYT